VASCNSVGLGPASLGYLVILRGFPAGPVFSGKWLILREVVGQGFSLSCLFLAIMVTLTAGMYLKLIIGALLQGG